MGERHCKIVAGRQRSSTGHARLAPSRDSGRIVPARRAQGEAGGPTMGRDLGADQFQRYSASKNASGPAPCWHRMLIGGGLSGGRGGPGPLALASLGRGLALALIAGQLPLRCSSDATIALELQDNCRYGAGRQVPLRCNNAVAHAVQQGMVARGCLLAPAPPLHTRPF